MPQHWVWILLIHFPISNIILQFCSDFCAAFAIENASSICVCIRAAYHMSICVYGSAAWAARDHRCVGTEDGVRCTHLWHNRRRLHTPCGPPRESDGEASTWYSSTWHTVPSDDDVWYSLLSAISTKNVYELSSHWHTVSIGWYVILCVGASLCVWDFLFSFFFCSFSFLSVLLFNREQRFMRTTTIWLEMLWLRVSDGTMWRAEHTGCWYRCYCCLSFPSHRVDRDFSSYAIFRWHTVGMRQTRTARSVDSGIPAKRKKLKKKQQQKSRHIEWWGEVGKLTIRTTTTSIFKQNRIFNGETKACS